MTAKTEGTFDSIVAAFVQQGLAQGFLRVHFTGATTPLSLKLQTPLPMKQRLDKIMNCLPPVLHWKL